ncbi:bZIP transcription factor bZIP-1 [Penicillium cf. griseofulvum]|uniref:BZIP transcription factor bZIP-1 n=1 Tax=Penicillium cf. griseofulvum TaxID=2972120 RepID=A0A9W9ITM4_9EURO|nr:bZIP transcription factor bZIP-1 [Penicillium cf. griseofulvum]KAJ5430598.1 bZIP transcription factor bZIP-1 [Penicillium cf. griseofulvum]KAJ5435633.1 bZIP transcription factor bZIP-1 [Penicillium cf. griseofulvum]
MSSQDEPPVKRRESRSGTRKVSTLSLEQLERKRANDREAQRSIRQRTKEHIEQLESQVATLQSQIAEMRPQNERFHEVMQHNALLENEVIRLKHQVASLTGRPEFASNNQPMAPFRSEWPLEEASDSALPGIPTTGALLPPHFTATSHTQRPLSHSAPRRASHQNDWQQPYLSTRSPSLGAASNPEFPNRIEPYPMDGQLNQGQPICQPQQQSESSFSQFTYSNRSLSMPSASPIPQPSPAPVYQPSPSSYPQPTDPTYEYSWAPPS